MPGALLGQELVHESDVGEPLLVSPKVGVIWILGPTRLADRRRDIVNAEPEARQSL